MEFHPRPRHPPRDKKENSIFPEVRTSGKNRPSMVLPIVFGFPSRRVFPKEPTLLSKRVDCFDEKSRLSCFSPPSNSKKGCVCFHPTNTPFFQKCEAPKRVTFPIYAYLFSFSSSTTSKSAFALSFTEELPTISSKEPGLSTYSFF